MTRTFAALTAASALAFLGAACSPEGAAPAPKEDMATPASTAGPIRSTGTVSAVDAAAGTVTLEHEAIPDINWPAMSMQFRAEDPAILQGLAAGDRVTFEIKNASETTTITMIEKQ